MALRISDPHRQKRKRYNVISIGYVCVLGDRVEITQGLNSPIIVFVGPSTVAYASAKLFSTEISVVKIHYVTWGQIEFGIDGIWF